MSAQGSRSARPGIVDVAALAGVSRQTVSNVINGQGRLSDGTRAKVEAAIERLGFQPNRFAQSLRSQRTMFIGFDMSGEQLELTNPFTITFLRALVRAASTHGYRVVTFTHEDGDPSDFRSTVTAGGVDGFVLSDSGADDVRSRVLADAGVPFVAFGRTAPDLPQTWVDIDNSAAMVAVVDHLVAAGHRRYAYVGFPTDVYWNAERLRATRQRLAYHGLELASQATFVGRLDDLRAGVRRLLESPERPDAVVTCSDAIAIMVVNVATSLGLRPGLDLAVTGFDAGPLRTMVEPSLTSVRIPVDAIASSLVNRLVAEMRAPTGEPGTVVATDLAVGKSA